MATITYDAGDDEWFDICAIKRETEDGDGILCMVSISAGGAIHGWTIKGPVAGFPPAGEDVLINQHTLIDGQVLGSAPRTFIVAHEVKEAVREPNGTFVFSPPPPAFKIYGIALHWDPESTQYSGLKGKLIWDESLVFPVATSDMVTYQQALQIYSDVPVSDIVVHIDDDAERLIKVVPPVGTFWEVRATDAENWGQVKVKINEVSLVPSNQMQLEYDGSVLADTATVGSVAALHPEGSAIMVKMKYTSVMSMTGDQWRTAIAAAADADFASKGSGKGRGK